MLFEQLRELGVQRGDTLMVHASMRRVGGRAEALLDALQHAVSPDGALLMLICGPEDEVFDARTSPAWSELGVLSEVFRTHPGVVLNAHPIARMGAWGRDAEALVSEPPLHDYYGPGSPLERLVQRAGKVLRLGADRDTVTLLHHAEYLAQIPDKRTIVHLVDVRTNQGTRAMRIRCLDDEDGIRPHEGIDYFQQILDDALATGIGGAGRVGGALAELLPAGALVSHGRRWMEAHL